MTNSHFKHSICLLTAGLLSSLVYGQSVQGGLTLTKQETTRLVDSIQALIVRNYYNKKTAVYVGNKLAEGLKQGKYYKPQTDSAIKAMNDDLLATSNDGHLYIQSIAGKEKSSGFDWVAYEKEQEIKMNHGFTQLEIIEGNIGYIKIIEFMHPKRAMQTAIAAMKFVENTEGLIIDLRGNGGGYAGIMEYILNHYFEGEPIELSKIMYADGKYVTTYSSDLIYGKLRINTPLYILVNNRTASAAEYFAYTLQAFKKAIIVGEKTAGGANRNEYFPLPHGFRMSISVASPVSSVTGTNWEGSGVLPDVVTTAAKEKAIELIKDKTK